MKFQTINPTNGDTIQEYDSLGKLQVDQKLKDAKKGFEVWKEMSLLERRKYIKKLGHRLAKKKKDLSETITLEIGKPLKESTVEVDKCVMLCDYFAKNAKKFLKDEKLKTEYKKSYISFQPLGVVASLMSWEFPLWQTLRFAVPSMLAGNVQIVKPSTATADSGGLKLEKITKECKFPAGVFSVTIGDTSTGTSLIESDVDAISFTGSSESGTKVAVAAMRNMKKVVLELGGSDPFIVLSDANMEKTVAAAAATGFLNCGQSAIAPKRMIVVKDILEQFTTALTEKIKALKVGDPMQLDTDVGPMVSEPNRQYLEQQLKTSADQGVKVLLGGKRIEGHGFFFQPTLLSAKNDTDIVKGTSGPVLSLISADGEEDALKLANATVYGLGASLWSENREKAEQLTKKLNAGMVFVNQSVRSDPRLPFGGTKKSGFSRELYKYGMLEMTNAKTIVIN